MYTVNENSSIQDFQNTSNDSTLTGFLNLAGQAVGIVNSFRAVDTQRREDNIPQGTNSTRSIQETRNEQIKLAIMAIGGVIVLVVAVKALK